MWPRCRAATVVAVVTLACCPSAHALDPSLDISQYAHTSWKVRDGFTKGLIVAIAQAPDGYLWLGTEFGLARFDGVRAVPWQPPTGQHLPSNNIQSLLFARDGTLWIGTLSGLASWGDGKLTTYPEMAGQIVMSLVEDRESAIWAGGSRPPAGGKLCSLRNARTVCYGGDGTLGVGIFGLYEDTLANLWVGTNQGFWRWKPGPPQFFPARPDTYGIRGLGEDDEHALLISLQGGIRRFMNGQIETRELPYRALTTWLRQIFRDRDGSLWFGTFTHGLVHVHQGKVDTFSSSDGLSGDSVYNILEDREGNVWVATNNGIDQFRAYNVPTISIKQGLGNSFAIAALAARNGSVWIARADGLDRWDQGKIFPYRTSNGNTKPGPTLAPSSLFEDSSGRIWAATLREFGYLDHDRVVSVRGYSGGYVRAIAEGPPGHLWVASDQSGLLHVFQGKVVQQLSWSGLGFEKYGAALAADPAKEGLWIGFWQGGIAYVANGKVQASYSVAEGLGQGIVNHLRIDSGGALWAATDGGLSRIEHGHVSTLASRNGLPCDGVFWTIEDDERAVWLYMPCGLVRIAREELAAWAADTTMTVKTRVLDASDGVGTHNWTRAYGPPVTKTQDGKIWFTTSDGVSIIDPHHVAINSLPPPVHIERIMADDKPYNPANGLQLPSGVRYLTIDYTALSFTVPEKVRFRYKLEGLDPDWREVGNDRKVQYSNPPPRHYRFRVIAANNSGVWNEAGASLEFSIAPAYYQTRWFQAAVVAAFLLMLWALHRRRVRQLAREFNMGLEARVSERTRIARELHDTLLQSFHGLLLRVQAATNQLPEGTVKQRFEGAIDLGAQAIAEGRDAVQGLRSSTIETNDLAEAVNALGQELATGELAENAAAFQVAVRGTPQNLHPILRDEVYRIAGEALRNAFRHARARQIDVEIRYDERQLRLRVRDDGKGMTPRMPAGEGGSGHFGLPGMHERAAVVGGRLDIWSQIDSGTEVELSIPAFIAYAKPSTRRRSWTAWVSGHDR